LEKDPTDRYQHIDDVIVDLNRQARLSQALHESSAPSAGWARAGWKPTGRWVGFVLAVLAVVVAVYAIFWQRSPLEKKTTEPPSGKMMLVVLPFENLGPPDVEYFTDGVTEEITSRLAALSGLGVISRTSAFQYKGAHKSIKQIGEELGVGYVLEGTVRWDRPNEGGSRVRVTPQLIRVADDTHLWSARYDRVLEDIFAVQSEIASNVIEQLNVTLIEPEREGLATRPTDNMEAYQAYLRGRDYMGRAGYSGRIWRLAVGMFERAVELDPNFALAYTDLANAHSQIFNLGSERTPEHIEKCKAAVDRAFELQPDLPEARLALGYYYYHCFRDYDRALEEFERAGKSMPNQGEALEHIGWIRRRQSRWDEALDVMNQSLELNPRDPSLLQEIGNSNLYLRRYDQAIGFYDRAIAVAPDQAWSYGFEALTHWLDNADLAAGRAALERAPGGREPWIDFLWFWQEWLERDYDAVLQRMATVSVELFQDPSYAMPVTALEGFAHLEKGDTAKARPSFEAARSILERELTARPDDSRVYSELGLVYAALGQEGDAVRAATRAVEITPVSVDAIRGPAYVEYLGWTYVLLGDNDDAIDKIDDVLSIPSLLSVAVIEIDPRWDPLRGDPKFQAVLEKHSRPTS
ncbi:MAG: tetratricopeptide repeat protein, partial [bacterium]